MLSNLGPDMLRVVHLPSGITVERSANHGRYMSKNKMLRCALKELSARIHAMRVGLNPQPAPVVREYDFVHGQITDLRTGDVHDMNTDVDYESPHTCPTLIHALKEMDIGASTYGKRTT